ncbi:MAG TPA: ABC transporter ATP-binding protein [Candidatus Kapabacteria bacterium]|nr:ABC transporter ATP-binding protein [Candidatus Kapabacteria bacterium]
MIQLKNLYKSFGEKPVLRGVDLTIPTGETFFIIGPSGCGKSVMLKHIVGLLTPDKGEVIIDGQNIGQLHEGQLYELRRKFGFLFQGAALFDSMTVSENIALGLVEHGETDRQKLDKIVAEKLELVGLPGIENLKPSELSGGMKKRVGLARALAQNPEYIFYDEPTTGLDPIMSDQIDELIADITHKLKVTSVVVTHDMFSVEKIAHRVALMHEGKIYFEGTPQELRESSDPIIITFIERFGMHSSRAAVPVGR